MLDELSKIGLSENEAKTYLALLEIGSATAQEISQKSAIKRATTYVQLETLMKKGLVTSFEKEFGKNRLPKTFFRAEDPDHLKKIMEQQKKEEKERENILREILPELSKLFFSNGERPHVRFFDGIEGLKTMQDEFLKIKIKEVLSFSSGDDILRIFPTHPEKYSPRRVGRKIEAKLIYTSSRGKILNEKDNNLLRETRFIPPEKFPFTCDIAMYGDRVAISALKNKPMGVIIESQEIADSMKAIFWLAWDAAEKYR